MIRQQGFPHANSTGHRMYSIPLCNLRGDSSGHVVTRSAARTADSADPTTATREAVAHPITDRPQYVLLGQSRHHVIVIVPVLVPSLCTLSSIRPNRLLFLEYSRPPPIRSVAKLPLFLSFWTAPRPAVCSRASPVPLLTPHSSTTRTTMLYNPFRYYQVLIPLFRSGSPFRHAISLLYHNTSQDNSPERP